MVVYQARRASSEAWMAPLWVGAVWGMCIKGVVRGTCVELLRRPAAEGVEREQRGVDGAPEGGDGACVSRGVGAFRKCVLGQTRQ